VARWMNLEKHLPESIDLQLPLRSPNRGGVMKRKDLIFVYIRRYSDNGFYNQIK
jgi:hypothetical protein